MAAATHSGIAISRLNAATDDSPMKAAVESHNQTAAAPLTRTAGAAPGSTRTLTHHAAQTLPATSTIAE